MILNYGCPRSGTTFLKKAMESTRLCTARIPDTSINHPMNSPLGLHGIYKIFKPHCAFVRIVRDKYEILDSFLFQKMKNPEIVLGKRTIPEIARFIALTEINTQTQLEFVNVVEIIHGDMDDAITFGKFRHDFEKTFRGMNFHYKFEGGRVTSDQAGLLIATEIMNAYNKVPSRHGKLSEGYKEQIATEDQKKELDENIIYNLKVHNREDLYARII